MSGEYEFAPATALEAAERDAATRGRTVASFEGIDSIWNVYTHSSIAYVDSAGERRRTPTGPYGHYMEYWEYLHAAHNVRGPRRFCDAEREAFTDGAEVWYLLCGEWTKGVVVGGITADRWGAERVQILRPGYRDALGLQMTWCYTTGVRVPGARVGLDFQWETRGTERKASVFFCEKCGSTEGKFGRSVFTKRLGDTWYDVAWGDDPIPKGFELADEHMLTPSVMECTCRPTGGTRIDSREYWRRVIAVEAAGFEVWDVPKERRLPGLMARGGAPDAEPRTQLEHGTTPITSADTRGARAVESGKVIKRFDASEPNPGGDCGVHDAVMKLEGGELLCKSEAVERGLVLATVREAFEKVKTTHAEWPINEPSDEAFRLQVTSLGVQGIIGAANTELPDSEDRRALVAEMAEWLQKVATP